MSEHSSSSTAAALREARRRNILENAANRLKLIEGVHSKLEKAPAKSFPKPEPELQVRETNTAAEESSSSENHSKLNDVIGSDDILQNPSYFLYRKNSKTYDTDKALEYLDCPEEDEWELDLDETEPNIGTTGTKENEILQLRGKIMTKKRRKNKNKNNREEIKEENEVSYFELFLKKRLHYVILALTANILLFFNVGYLFYENIFVPFYTLLAIELLSGQREQEDIHLLFYFLILPLPKSLQRFTVMFMSLTFPIFSDLCIYLFTFMIGIKVLNIQE